MDSIIPQDATPQKQCCTCKQYFFANTEYFHRHKSSRSNDGLSMRCKPCARQQTIQSRTNPNRKTYPKLDGQKRCSECGNVKPATLEYFHASSHGGQGLTHVCSECWKSYTERLAKERVANYQETTRTCTICLQTFPATLEYFFQEGPGLCTRCKDCRAKQLKANYKLNEEERKASRRIYLANNRELANTYSRNRQARKKNAPGHHTAEDIQNQLERQKRKCYWCHKKLGTGLRAYHVDHVIPLTREGTSNDPWNLVIACHTCNERRQNKLPHEWPEGGRLL